MGSPQLHSLAPSPFIPLLRANIFISSTAIAAVVLHRLNSLLTATSPLSFLLFSAMLLAEMIFAFQWANGQAYRWRPVSRREFPEKVSDDDLPRLDVFVCTADPHKEPPISAANTALSALAFEYPPEKLSVYLSDDGGSELTLFAFMEAARFAAHWLPFCRERKVEQRCPEAFLGSGESAGSDEIKIIYENMKDRVERVMERGRVTDEMLISQQEREIFHKFKGFTRRDHPSIIQVLLESSQDKDVSGNPLPNLVYVSREKSSAANHNFKAGALNALVRVSGVMTNSPVILTLDSDTYSNDPLSPRRAMCYLMDPATASDLAYVQFPQHFRGVNKNDIYGSEMKRLFCINPKGMDGLHGPNYVGSGCFLRRRSLHGSPSSPSSQIDANCAQKSSTGSELVLEKAHEVTVCSYEDGTQWGSMIGFRYGSLVEDYNTGYHLQCLGWKSVLCNPERSAFLGEVPVSLNDVIRQNKRWYLGLLEVTFSKYCPLTYGIRMMSLLMGLCYAFYAFWAIWCIPVAIYGLLPQLALAYQFPLFPRVSDPWFYLYAYLFLASYTQDLLEFISSGSTLAKWWNDQRIWMIRGITSYLFASIEFALQMLGISASGFNVTSKVMEDEQGKRYQKGLFEFGMASPFFVLIGFVAMLNLICLGLGFRAGLRRVDEMFAQMFISAFVVVNAWPVYAAMFLRKDGGRMPGRVTCSALLLAIVLISSSSFVFDG